LCYRLFSIKDKHKNQILDKKDQYHLNHHQEIIKKQEVQLSRAEFKMMEIKSNMKEF
jgi:hypothetical protein